MKTLLLTVSLVVCFLTGLFASSMAKPATDKPRETAKKKPLTDQERLDQAIQQAHLLYKELAAKNFNDPFPSKELQYLPDQNFAENGMFHDNQTAAFSIPPPPVYGAWPGYRDQVAFYSSIFVRMNRKAPVGDVVDYQPTGVYIVCTVRGEVTTVPANEVRCVSVTMPNGTKASYYVFPGMSQYPTAKKLWK